MLSYEFNVGRSGTREQWENKDGVCVEVIWICVHSEGNKSRKSFSIRTIFTAH